MHEINFLILFFNQMKNYKNILNMYHFLSIILAKLCAKRSERVSTTKARRG